MAQLQEYKCPCCGGAIAFDSTIQKMKCPYCDTSYYDMSAVDFESGEPFYLKIRTNMNGQQVYITQLVKPILNTIEMSTDTVDCYDHNANVASYIFNNSLTTNISFIGISDQNGNLMTMTVE